jgi:hypothetical protein
VFAPLASANSTEVIEALKACARTVQQEARIECYEALGKRVLASGEATPDVAAAAPVEQSGAAQKGAVEAAAATAAVSAPKAEVEEHMGGYQYEEKPSDHPDNAVHARVTVCQQDKAKIWYFKFENGQVWKQVDRNRLNFQGCDFAVTILKDGFGYKMQIDGSDRQVRISRRK